MQKFTDCNYNEYHGYKRIKAFCISYIEKQKTGVVLAGMGDESPGRTVVDKEWFDRHKPEKGGYLVVYPDGYTSYSPAGPFEESYKKIERSLSRGFLEARKVILTELIIEMESIDLMGSDGESTQVPNSTREFLQRRKIERVRLSDLYTELQLVCCQLEESDG